MTDKMTLKDFSELSQDELKVTEGGSVTVLGILTGAATIWVLYEISYAAGKASVHLKGC